MEIEPVFREKRITHRKKQFDENIINVHEILQKLKSLDNDRLQKYCLKLESFLKHDVYYDIDGLDLFSELKVLK